MGYPTDEEFNQARNAPIPRNRPKIVCLCGSTKFKAEYEECNAEETMKGNIVLSVGWFGHSSNRPITEEQKQFLDELHKQKIYLADQVIIICPKHYIGESTLSEIRYAEKLGKPISYREK